nr:uncharacterized protein CI109_005702 [Kwoniella shandongensis]KAA5525955.1 hypothetical protein CI109_005702 [Kwoniella shandongensis]
MAEPRIPPPQSRHPFAYSPGPTLPFAALGAGRYHMDNDLVDRAGHRRADSEVLSRGAGMNEFARPATAMPGGRRNGEDIPGKDSVTSPGMGTFGLEGKMSSVQVPVTPNNLPNSGAARSPNKSVYTTRKPPPSDPLPPDPIPMPNNGPAHPKPDSDEQAEDGRPHLHRAHHDFPFSHAEAQGRQFQAMEDARAAALAQLEAAQRNSDIMMEQEMLAGMGMEPTEGEAAKGPRQTFDTTTSGPSFGHLLHQDGFPLSARPSMQPPMDGFGPDPTFFRIPFGVPMGMTVPRPLMVMRDSGGARLGLGLPDLLDMMDTPTVDRRGPEDRSAFVETVEDEEDTGYRTEARTPSPAKPARTNRTGNINLQPSRGESQSVNPTPSAPRPDMGAFDPYPNELPTLTYKDRLDPGRYKEPSQAPTKVASKAPSGVRSKSPKTAASAARNHAPTVRSEVPPLARSSRTAPRAHSVVSQPRTFDEPEQHTIYSVRTKNTPTIIPRSDANGEAEQYEQESVRSMISSPMESAAPTTISNVKRLVAESKFHDETLCQLLDAARLNLIGEEAKKALQRAARARVIELRDLRARGQAEEATLPPAAVQETRSRESTPKKGKRSKSKDRRRASGSTAKPRSEKAETVAASQPRNAPTWAEDIMSRLAQFDARFAAIEQEQLEREAAGASLRPTTQHTQMSQDVPSNLIDELIFHELPSSGFTNGIKMPDGLTRSIIFPQQASIPPMPGQDHRSHLTGYPSNDVPANVTQYTDTRGLGQAAKSRYGHTSELARTDRQQHGTQQPTMTSSDRTAAGTNRPHSKARTTGGGGGDVLSWGSEVELPQPGENVQPPRAPTIAPTINILAPTESNVDGNRGSTRAPSPRIISRVMSQAASQRLPDQVDTVIITEQTLPETAVPDPRERDLPPPPSESVKSHRPTSPPKSTPFNGNTIRTPRTQPTTNWARERESVQSFQPDRYPPQPFDQPPRAVPIAQSRYTAHAAAQNQQPQQDPASDIHMRMHDQVLTSSKQAVSPPRDVIHVVDPLFSNNVTEGWQPWDRLTQTLYSWAMIAEEKSFVRALEDISLGRQVEDFPLSIFLIMTYKRWVKRNLNETPPVPCDKLFVPPNLAVAINVAVHSRRYHEAKEILLGLWDSLGSKEPPRVIVSLAPLGNEADQWAAHRYDLVTKHLTTYRVSHLAEIQTDGRSFWWWEAIRQAWPQLQVPEMEDLERRGGQRVVNEHRQPEWRHENSLFAANIGRNLLLGYRPEREQDLTKLRELVWAEVKRLLTKKRHGRLLVGAEPYDG